MQEHGQLRAHLHVVQCDGLLEQPLCSVLGRWPQILTTASPSRRENCSEVSGANVAWANVISQLLG